MGKDKDFSVFTKSGHVLNCFFLCCLLQFESIREKTGKLKSPKNWPFYSSCSYQYRLNSLFSQCKKSLSTMMLI